MEQNRTSALLFSFISINWRVQPLTSLETVIELISHTTTKGRLQVTAIKDSQIYPTGITVTDAELKALNIVRDSFHGDLLAPFSDKRAHLLHAQQSQQVRQVRQKPGIVINGRIEIK